MAGIAGIELPKCKWQVPEHGESRIQSSTGTGEPDPT